MRTPHHRPLPILRLVLALALTLVTAVTVALVGPASSSNAASSTLSNGCAVSARGIPSCGAYVGAAYGSNTDPTSWESSMGKSLGVHRTYWSSSQVASAVKSATTDATKHRVPWMSFKVPYSWKDMAAGKGDAWARDLATKLKSTGGPVWVAMVHEPENDGGDIQQWKAMQAHLAPIMRAAAPNLGYSIILMGYHEFHGDAKYAMSAIWPNTKIDVAGFDIYETYGAKNYVWKQFDTNYYQPIQAWSQKTGVPWGLAETGFSDGAAKAKSTWMSTTYNQMKARGGIAFSYFNTSLNSTTNWRLSFAAKQSQFTGIIKSAPTMR